MEVVSWSLRARARGDGGWPKLYRTGSWCSLGQVLALRWKAQVLCLWRFGTFYLSGFPYVPGAWVVGLGYLSMSQEPESYRCWQYYSARDRKCGERGT